MTIEGFVEIRGLLKAGHAAHRECLAITFRQRCDDALDLRAFRPGALVPPSGAEGY